MRSKPDGDTGWQTSASMTPDASPSLRGDGRSPPKLRKWIWPPLQTYNGFTSQERVRGWQLLWLLIDLGLLPLPTKCSITGSIDRPTYHGENYYDPCSSFPVSAGVHRILHRRFRDPDPWRQLVDAHTVTGDEWFCALSLERIDLAADLRARHGPGIVDIFARALLPQGLNVPAEQIYFENGNGPI